MYLFVHFDGSLRVIPRRVFAHTHPKNDAYWSPQQEKVNEGRADFKFISDMGVVMVRKEFPWGGFLNFICLFSWISKT